MPAESLPGFAASIASDLASGLAAPTIATKLAVPVSPSYLIIRKRLLDVLDAGAEGPLTVLCAPAGAGKTILLASWIQTRRPPGPVAWLSLDQDDDDACRLAADLLGALSAAGVIRRGGTLDRLSPPLGARADAFLAALINGLARLRGTFVLVLDDLHVLSSPQASAMIDFLVRHAPSQCRLMLAGRSNPPIPIERLRVGGALTELRMADLAFDLEETRSLCLQLGLELEQRDVERLWRRTEGWPAMLRLAGLSAQGERDPRRLVCELAGTDRALSDYLVSEVLSNLPADRRMFMLRTCLVDQLPAELSDVLSGAEGGALTLAELERSGAPLQQIGAGQPCYRYHPLFAELLRAHLSQSHPEEVPLLHRRAAGWLSQHGEIRAAVRHALAGESWEQAGALIEHGWLDLFVSGASATLRDTMSKLPQEAIAARPRLAAAFAGSRLQDGDLQGADRYLSLAKVAREREDEQLAIMLAAVRLLRSRLRGDATAAQRHSSRLARLARDPTDGRCRWAALRSFALCNVGATLLWSGRASDALAPLREALALASEGRCEHVALDCNAQLAVLHLLGGRLTEAQRAASEAASLAELGGWEDGPGPACAHLALAGVAYLRGELGRAEGLAAQAASAAESAELSVWLAARILQAVTLCAGGPKSAARAQIALEAVKATAAECDPLPPFLRVALKDAAARIALALGDATGLAAIASARFQLRGSANLVVRQAQAELLLGRPERALGRLAGLLGVSGARSSTPATRQSATAIQLSAPAAQLPAPAIQMPAPAIKSSAPALHPVTELEAWLTCALAEQARDRREESSAALERALALAERERICGPFIACRPAAHDLLAAQAQRGTDHPALLETLLDALGPDASGREEIALAQPLSDRELKILRFLPTMLSNAEIGAEIFVSLNTVKTHLRSIYRKLGVGNRADAVQRARTLGLLPRGIRRPRVNAIATPRQTPRAASPRLAWRDWSPAARL